ncbi:MAG: leucine-rich repeat domain-containing protein [Spirochaetales bacterium]|nr:leucine-rich repeat domain-containing protein [Spirochaetales bacterium]
MTHEEIQKAAEEIAADPIRCQQYLELQGFFEEYEPDPDEEELTTVDLIYDVLAGSQITITAPASLKKLPALLFELKQIEALNLHENSFVEIPSDIKNLKNLRVLRANDNLISSVPVEIKHLTNLEELYLHDNPIPVLPDSFEPLTRLHTLGIHNLKLEFVPDSLYDLTSLRYLSLQGDIADDVDFSQIESLESVDLYGGTIDPESLRDRYSHTGIIFSYIPTPYEITEKDEALKEHIQTIDPDVPAASWSSVQREAYNTLLETIGKAINYKLKEGYTYCYDYFIFPDGGHRAEIHSSFYGYKEGVIDRGESLFLSEPQFKENQSLFTLVKWLSLTFPSGRKVKITAGKDCPVSVKVCDPKDLLKDIHSYYLFEHADYYNLDSGDLFIITLDFEDCFSYSKEGFIQRGETVETIEQLSWHSCGPSQDQDFIFLSLALEPEHPVTKMRFEISREGIAVFADRSYPYWDISLWK